MERENERLTASSVEGSVGCLRGVGAGSPEGDLVQMGLDRSTGETGKKGGGTDPGAQSRLGAQTSTL